MGSGRGWVGGEGRVRGHVSEVGRGADLGASGRAGAEGACLGRCRLYDLRRSICGE